MSYKQVFFFVLLTREGGWSMVRNDKWL